MKLAETPASGRACLWGGFLQNAGGLGGLQEDLEKPQSSVFCADTLDPTKHLGGGPLLKKKNFRKMEIPIHFQTGFHCLPANNHLPVPVLSYWCPSPMQGVLSLGPDLNIGLKVLTHNGVLLT